MEITLIFFIFHLPLSPRSNGFTQKGKQHMLKRHTHICVWDKYVFLKRNSIFSPAVDFFVFQDPLSHLCCSPDKNELKEENILIQMKSTRWGNLITGGPGFSPANFKEKWHEGARMWFFLIVPWRMNLDASVLYCTPRGGLKWVYLPPVRAGIHGRKYPYVFLFLQALSADSLSWVAATVSWEPPRIIQWDLGGPGVRESGKHGESWGCSPETGLGGPGLHMRLSVAKISNSFTSTEQLAWAWPFPPLALILSSRKKSQKACWC